jgi:16S rRNA (guanine527-N7)-methyltransferase
MNTNRIEMAELFSRSGIDLSDEALGLFFRFYEELREHNDDLGLTGIASFEDVVIKHFVDSVMVSRLVKIPTPLLDIGSGAGFPGIPLKIIAPDINIILAETRKKRVRFLFDVIERLSLSGIEVFPHAVTGDFPLPVAGAITRALESGVETLGRCAPFLDPGGMVILMKGPASAEETSRAASKYGHLFSLEWDIPYTIPGTDYRRRLVVFKRIEEDAANRSGGVRP